MTWIDSSYCGVKNQDLAPKSLNPMSSNCDHLYASYSFHAKLFHKAQGHSFQANDEWRANLSVAQTESEDTRSGWAGTGCALLSLPELWVPLDKAVYRIKLPVWRGTLITQDKLEFLNRNDQSGHENRRLKWKSPLHKRPSLYLVMPSFRLGTMVRPARPPESCTFRMKSCCTTS